MSSSAVLPAPTDELTEQLRDVITAEQRRWQVPGLAVLVVHEGRVILVDGFGRRDLADEAPVTADTLFAIGSSTKTFTAAVAALLVDDGLLCWDAPIRDYFPTFRLQDDVATSQCSMRDLLSHRTGIPRHDFLCTLPSRAEVLAALRHLAATAGFRQQFQYCNLTYVAAGEIAAGLTGSSYEELVRSRIFDPLGMTRSNCSIAVSRADPDHATPYRLGEDGGPAATPFLTADVIGPAGSINSSINDMARWVAALLGPAADATPPLLSTAALTAMYTPAIAFPYTPTAPGGARLIGYGLGLVLEEYRGIRVAQHGGNIEGFSAQVTLAPQTRTAVVVLTNLHNCPARDSIPYLILDRLFGLQRVDHGQRVQATHNAALAQFEQLRAARMPDLALPLVRPLTDYTGLYRHPAYGTLTVTFDGNELTAELRGHAGRVEHQYLEVFLFHTVFQNDPYATPLQFTHSLDGRVNSAQLVLEPTAAPIRFDRQPDPAAPPAELLDNLVGTYSLGPVDAVVTRPGPGKLRLSVPGSSAVDLEPVSGMQFRAFGALIEFRPDGTLHTPHGVFTKAPQTNPAP